MCLLCLTIGLVDEIIHLGTDGLGTDGLNNKVEHHTYACHRRAEVVGNHGVHLIAVADSALQLDILLHDDALGSHKRNLVHHAHDELLLIKWF